MSLYGRVLRQTAIFFHSESNHRDHIMSEIALKKAARIPLGPSMDLKGKLVLMLIADRANDDGLYHSQDDSKMHSEMAAELRAVLSRLKGEFVIVPGADAFRVTRVVQALEDADIRKAPTIQ
jgi:hypothetical protein